MGRDRQAEEHKTHQIDKLYDSFGKKGQNMSRDEFHNRVRHEQSLDKQSRKH